MTKNIKQPWILAGYEIFSNEGPKGLKIEVISRKVKKSKSSFYHFFADIDCFVEELLVHHITQTKIIAEREKLCKNIAPELLIILLEVKQDLFFHRQLRINRHIPNYKKCFEDAHKEIENVLLKIWSDTLDLSNQTYIAKIVFGLMIENFYLRITEETLTYEWLLNYINEIRFMVEEIKKKS
jgi:AcrR family transcriptional regulator